MVTGIVIFGEMGSGKDTLADELKNIVGNAKIFNLGMLCRDIMRITKVNGNWAGRERDLGQAVADCLRSVDQNVMNDYIFSLVVAGMEFEFTKMNSEEIIDCLKNLSCISIIVGGRTKEDLKYWRDKGFLIVGIKTDNELRIDRITLRNGEVNQMNNYTHSTENEAREIVSSQCDYCVENNESLQDLINEANKICDLIRL